MAPRFAAWGLDSLENITNGFSQENFISEFQFGRIYRAKDSQGRHLMVKVWDKEEVEGCEVWPIESESRMHDECLLTYDDRVQFHPNMIKISGKSWPGLKSMMVYVLNPLDTLHNLQDKETFSWLRRVKVALDIASFVKGLHLCEPMPYLVRNISAAHIILDQDYNAKLYDFSMISGGILADKTELLNQRLQGCYGYIDPDYVYRGKWSTKCDVFAYGVILIGLLSKRVVLGTNKKTNPGPLLYEWAHKEYLELRFKDEQDPSKFSLVHSSMESEPGFYASDGVALTNLALQCVEHNPQKRPTMKQVVKVLKELLVIRNNADIFGDRKAPTVQRFVHSELQRLMMKISEFYLKVKENALKPLLTYQIGNNKLVSVGREMQSDPPNGLSWEDLKRYTSGFSEENFINIYPFGKLYHGKIDFMKVTVKTWEDVNTRGMDELILLQHPKFVSHPHIAELIGYYYENEKLGAVYKLQSLDSLYNLVPKDSFTWHRRIVFILELARLLQYLQQRDSLYSPYVLRNISPHDILVDIHYKPKLFNFGVLLGGILTNRELYRIEYFQGYMDPHTNCDLQYTQVSDIYSFGMVILNLITKICKPEIETDFNEWVLEKFEDAKAEVLQPLKNFCLVSHHFFMEAGFDPTDGRVITKLAMDCIQRDFSKRPTINQIVKILKSLKILKIYLSTT